MILVTGSSGLVGREVASRLAGRAPVRLALRKPAHGEDGITEAERVRFDFRDPETFDAALRGVGRVFLLRPPRLARPRRDFGPFVAAMRRAGVGQVVFLSVRGAAGNPLLPHHGIERLLEASGLPWTHLRPNDFMQNFATVHRADIRGRGEMPRRDLGARRAGPHQLRRCPRRGGGRRAHADRAGARAPRQHADRGRGFRLGGGRGPAVGGARPPRRLPEPGHPLLPAP